MATREQFSLTGLFSSRLFWKFFAAILLAQVAATLAIGAAIWWKNRQATSVETQLQLLDTSPRASESIESAAATLQFGGEAALMQLLQKMQHHRVTVVDLGTDKKTDLIGRPISASMLQEAELELQRTDRNEFSKASVRKLELKGKSYLLFLLKPTQLPSRGLHEIDHMLPTIGSADSGPRNQQHDQARDRDGGLNRHQGPQGHPAQPPSERQEPRRVAPPPPPLPPANEGAAADFPSLETNHPSSPPLGADRGPQHRDGPKRDMKGPPRNSVLTPWVLIAAAIFVSLTFAAFLAWLFTRPLMALQTAFEEAAQGKLEPRFTERKHLIDDELHQLGRSFDHMASRLRAVMDQQTKLMHDVSHELRSPLARMQAAIGLIHQQPDRTLTYLDRIERESGRMDHLIEELLTLARLEAGAFAVPKEAIYISEVMDAMIDDWRFEAEQQGQTIDYTLTQDFKMLAQFDLIARAIENVVRNAIKYSPTQSQIRIIVDQLTSDAHADAFGIVQVADQGPGVAESDLASIFDPFYRSSATTQAVHGHGLGLAITKQIVHHHQGTIIARNRTEGGLQISLQFPLA
ncbi:ATP-binding protein [Undibacterium cyanobacteriorum]|uniref:histidine kinase n=1 Tax=Undibacterium cyanobacteriorum TaxID=3073561 RepID=A0ABY9RLM5_9BURK|nr:ATP-binding protein [Undibacterium sp. 20NA77.5]WMW81297.1 ATP-binding protein [Undibacterium sp. 20NA77.5]